MQNNLVLELEINNPCKECLVKVTCTHNCDELNKCVDHFVTIFDKQTSVGIAAEYWLNEIEVRPRVIKLWEEHGYK